MSPEYGVTYVSGRTLRRVGSCGLTLGFARLAALVVLGTAFLNLPKTHQLLSLRGFRPVRALIGVTGIGGLHLAACRSGPRRGLRPGRLPLTIATSPNTKARRQSPGGELLPPTQARPPGDVVLLGAAGAAEGRPASAGGTVAVTRAPELMSTINPFSVCQYGATIHVCVPAMTGKNCSQSQ